jgi:hypothetical protein
MIFRVGLLLDGGPGPVDAYGHDQLREVGVVPGE